MAGDGPVETPAVRPEGGIGTMKTSKVANITLKRFRQVLEEDNFSKNIQTNNPQDYSTHRKPLEVEQSLPINPSIRPQGRKLHN